MRKLKKIRLIQARIRGHLARKRFELLKYRKKIADELHQSEEVYVKNLNVILNRFLIPLRERVDTKDELVTKDQLKTIFSEIEVIYNYHNHFLQELQKLMEKFNYATRLGDLLLEMVNHLLLFF